MVELKAITEENFIDAFHLRLAPEQEAFPVTMRELVDANMTEPLVEKYGGVLAELDYRPGMYTDGFLTALYREQCQPFGIYAEGKMIGYVMVIYDYDVPEYDIWHMMIDESSQGRGYGGDALDRVLDYIRTKPFRDSDRVALTCNKGNPVARKLYERKGFVATGVEDEDEIEMALTLE